MALVPFTGTITATDLNANFDDKTATITTQRAAGRKDQTAFHYLSSLADTTALSLRTFGFVAADNFDVRILYLRVTDGTASRGVTGTLTVDSGDADYLGDEAYTISVTTVVGTVDSRDSGDLEPSAELTTAFRLIKGVRYRLTLENTSAGTTVTGPLHFGVQLRSRRRTA